MISVCIATYNGEKYIEAQLRSILSELGECDEVIISDDRSTDSTIKIIERLNDARIKILHHIKQPTSNISAKHIYTSANFENALNHASGEYVFLSDQDDIWVEKRVEKMINKLKSHVLVMCNYNIIDENDIVVKEKVLQDGFIKKSMILNIVSMPFHGCCIAFRRKEILSIALPWPRNLILHDNWIGFIAIYIDTIYFIDEPLLLYRRHDSNVSGNTNNSLFYKLRNRIVFITQLYKRILRHIFI